MALISDRLTYMLGCFGTCLVLNGCVTPAEEQQIKDDILSLQARVLQAENQLSDQSKELSSATNRQEASVSTRMDKISMEIQRLKGEMDAVKVGVTTGRLPGAEADAEGSVSQTLENLTERISQIEESQNKILEVIEKSTDSKKVEKKEKSKATSEKKNSSLRSLSELRSAFEKKKFKLISEDGPQILAAIQDKDEKIEATFLVAESHFKTGDTRDAALRYNEYIEAKPTEKVPHALLRMGDCFKKLGDTETAKIYYQELMQKFSSSDEAKSAKEKLAKL